MIGTWEMMRLVCRCSYGFVYGVLVAKFATLGYYGNVHKLVLEDIVLDPVEDEVP